MPIGRRRFDFAFDPRYRVAAMAFGVTPRTAWVEVGDLDLRVRFGPWSLTTDRTNIAGAEESGAYSFIKTAGPPHLSFADRGITFATNGERGLCLRFHQPVRGIEPSGHLRHPGATLTVADIPGLRAALGV